VYLVFGEIPKRATLIGGAIIISAVFLHSVCMVREESKQSGKSHVGIVPAAGSSGDAELTEVH